MPQSIILYHRCGKKINPYVTVEILLHSDDSFIVFLRQVWYDGSWKIYLFHRQN